MKILEFLEILDCLESLETLENQETSEKEKRLLTLRLRLRLNRSLQEARSLQLSALKKGSAINFTNNQEPYQALCTMSCAITRNF